MHKYRLIGIGCSTTLRVAAWQLNKFCSVEYPTLPRLAVVTAVVVVVAVTLGLRTFAPSTVECKPISHTVKPPLLGHIGATAILSDSLYVLYVKMKFLQQPYIYLHNNVNWTLNLHIYV